MAKKNTFRRYMESKDWTCRPDVTYKKSNYSSSVETTGNYKNARDVKTSL